MAELTDRLWPFSKKAALLSIPVLWIALAFALYVTHQYLSWPDAKGAGLVVAAVFLVGLLPVGLIVLDVLASGRAVLDIMGVKIDFSERTGISASFGLPDNIGIPGIVVAGSGPMQIAAALERATENEVAVLDIKQGNSWWLTRLFALCAGAARAGTPQALVFIGTKENVSGTFLGWTEPQVALRALLNDKTEYKSVYLHAASIAKQLGVFEGTTLLPTSPPGMALHNAVHRYAEQEDYVRLGDAAFEQILMDQLAMEHENLPEKLTLGRLQQLLEHCLYRDAIELNAPGVDQVKSLLEAKGPFIALAKEGRYQSLLKVEVGERILLRKLVMQSKRAG